MDIHKNAHLNIDTHIDAHLNIDVHSNIDVHLNIDNPHMCSNKRSLRQMYTQLAQMPK